MNSVLHDQSERTAIIADEADFFVYDTLHSLDESAVDFPKQKREAMDALRDVAVNLSESDFHRLACELYWNWRCISVPEIAFILDHAMPQNQLCNFVGLGPPVTKFCFSCKQYFGYRPRSRSDEIDKLQTCDPCKLQRKQESIEHTLAWREKQQRRIQEVQALRSMPYKDYLKTDHWKSVRLGALRRADNACQLCNAKTTLHVHHRTYVRRGEERNNDVIALCAECHKTFHGKA